jgi:hypothetical protein
MTFEQCEAAETCALSGVVTLSRYNHAEMAILQLENDACVSLSLPDKLVRKVRKSGSLLLSVKGRVFPMNPAIGHNVIFNNGRRVGPSECGNFYVFVD